MYNTFIKIFFAIKLIISNINIFIYKTSIFSVFYFLIKLNILNIVKCYYIFLFIIIKYI